MMSFIFMAVRRMRDFHLVISHFVSDGRTGITLRGPGGKSAQLADGAVESTVV